MTPGERWRWAKHNRLARKIQLLEAQGALEDAEMEYHYARFLHTAASTECPTCQAAPGAYCAIFRRPDGTYTGHRDGSAYPMDKLVALFLHPARTTTPEALEAAR